MENTALLDLEVPAASSMPRAGVDLPVEAKLPRNIDSTMLTAFRACPRKFHNEFIFGLRGRTPSIHLHAGGVFASTLEHFYTAIYRDSLSTDAAHRSALAHYTAAWGSYPYEPETSTKSFDRVWEAFSSYVATYPPHTDHVQPWRTEKGYVTTEYTFAVPIIDPAAPLHPETGEPFLFTGRFDLLGEYHSRPCIRDEKTTGSFTKTWADKWALRSQFLGYVWAMQQFGYALDTVVIRGIAIQKTQIQHREAIQVYSPYMVDRWYVQLIRDLHRIVDCWKSGYYDYNFGDACDSFGQCQFRSLCTAKDESVWYPEYTVRRWDPLHREDAAD